MGFKKKFKTKIINPLIENLKEGAQPKKLSLTIMLGITFGIIPFLGVNTAICFLLSIIFRLNIIIIQIINYTVFPIQLILIVPFFKLGEAVFGASNESVALSTLSDLASERWLNSLSIIIHSNMKALAIWLIIMLPLAVIGYFWIKKRLISWGKRFS